jgi:FkbM family methyltransferase
MFYMTGIVAIAASGIAWKVAHRPVAQSLTAFTLERDKQYPFVVDAYGFKYQGHTGNVIDEFALRYGAWEKDRLFFVRDYLKNVNDPNAVVIDVGANTGNHSLFYSRHSARVLAFEPFPPVIDMFKQNLALNPHITNVELFEVGLGDADAELPFAAPVSENHGQGSFRADAPQDPGMKQYPTKLRVVVGDEYLQDKNVGPVAFIKVDVEGFEEPVLKGLRQLIEKNRPMLEIEVSSPPTGTVDSFDRLRSLFPENYEFFVLPASQDGFVKGTYHLEKLDPKTIAKGDQIELVACPRERLRSLPGQ